jgi:hypothetical protein
MVETVKSHYVLVFYSLWFPSNDGSYEEIMENAFLFFNTGNPSKAMPPRVPTPVR